MRSFLRLLPLLVPALAGCGRTSAGPAASTVTLRMRPATGLFDVAQAGQPVFQNATADVLFDAGSGPQLAACTDNGPHSIGTDGALECTSGQVELRLLLTVPPGQSYFTAQVSAMNRGQSPITVLRLAPLVVEPDHGGALWLGANPAHHRVLENGQLGVLDQSAQLVSPADPPLALAEALPIPLRGNSVSNWNHVVADNDSSHSLVAGYLTFDRAIPTLGIAPSAGAAGPNGRQAFSYWAESALLFHGKVLKPGDSVSSELLYVDPDPPDPLAALEQYADVVAQHQGITTWPHRGHPVPVNWCSWTGGSSTGGFGQAIDANLIQQNLAIYQTEFQPFGANTLEIDDGWEQSYGDWSFRADAFPSGATGEVATIAQAGLSPGLWMAPFSVDPASMVAQQHPDWLQPVEDGAVGLFGKDRQTLDLTNPAVLSHVASLFKTERDQGWTWSKVDFTYNDLLGKPQYDPSQTNIEAWRHGWKVIRDTLGPETFLLGIGVMGPNIGRLDAMRVTTDDGPQWDESNPDNALSTDRAFKATVRTGSRRWFYQNRIWVNHDDMIFFRSNPDPSVPPLTLDESRAFATWVGLSGGVVEIGDKLTDLEQHPEWIDVLRRIMPVWPDGARPLDVLQRDYPEQYRQHIVAPAGTWDVVGLINWGTNRDWTATPPAPMPEATRTYHVTCDGDCLAYEFWSEQFVGRFTGGVDVSVDPRTAKVIAIRKPTGVPQLLGSNRQISQGATDMSPLTWDASEKTLRGTILGAAGTANAPFTYHLAFYVPDGMTLNQASIAGSMDATATQTGSVVDFRFSLPPAADGAMVPFTLTFQ